MTAAFDYSATILSQYANSPTILAMLEDFSECVDPAADIDAFFDAVWNIDTAQGFGLDIWGRIVGVGRVYPVATGSAFGFAGTDLAGFNQEAFYSGAQLTQNFALSDDAYRRLILAKAMANISDGTIPSINAILLNMFAGRGKCYVVDKGGDGTTPMTMTYKFEFALTPIDLTLVTNSGVLPHPACVAVSVEHL